MSWRATSETAALRERGRLSRRMRPPRAAPSRWPRHVLARREPRVDVAAAVANQAAELQVLGADALIAPHGEGLLGRSSLCTQLRPADQLICHRLAPTRACFTP